MKRDLITLLVESGNAFPAAKIAAGKALHSMIGQAETCQAKLRRLARITKKRYAL